MKISCSFYRVIAPKTYLVFYNISLKNWNNVRILLVKIFKSRYVVTLAARGVVGSAAAICVAAGLGGVALNVRN